MDRMKSSVAPIRRQIQVCIGKAGTLVGSLVYVRQGRRENCAIAYDETWLTSSERLKPPLTHRQGDRIAESNANQPG